MIDTLAVVGATGAVGRIIISLLIERDFPAKRLKLLASPRSAGEPITVAGRTFDVEVLKLDQSHKPLSIEFPLTERTSSTNKML